jgi:hypothetical protein
MFSFISELFPSGTKIPKTLALVNTYIKYGISTTIKLWIKGDMGCVEGKRKNAFLGNMSSLLALYNGRLVSDTGIFDGMNSGVIGPDGSPDFGLVEDILRKQTMWRSEVARSRALVEQCLPQVNLISVVYNMLRLYYMKLHGDVLVSKEHNYYDNGHIAITNKQAFGYDGLPTKLQDSVEFLTQGTIPTYLRDGLASSDSVLFYDFGAKIEPITAAILRIVHSEWVSKAPFGLAHSSPALSDKYVLVNTGIQARDFKWQDMTASMIKTVIGEFVRRHSCYRDFEYAYGMVVSVMTRPVPRSAEAIVWSDSQCDVLMPKPVCIRGLIPEIYCGSIYTRGPEWQDCYYSWYKSSGAGVAHSVALMEAVYAELFHLTRVNAYDDVDRDSFMAYATGITECPNAGIMMDTVLACMRYGREYSFRYVTSCGVARLDTIPLLMAASKEVTIKDDEADLTYDLADITGIVGTLNIHDYAPVTYPSLSYGVNEDGYYLNGDKMEMVVKHRMRDRKIIFNDPAEFSKFMSAMRLFGYDVKAVRGSDGRVIHNWADNASGRYIYVHDPNDDSPRFTIDPENIVKRTNNWLEIPSFYGDVTYGYELGPKALAWFSGDQRIAFGGESAVSVKRTEYQQAVAKLIQAKPTVRIVPLHKRADFYETRITVPATRPALAPASTELSELPTIQTGVTAQELDETGSDT